jgi:branched-chain amino acid transport system substrate-binding protein
MDSVAIDATVVGNADLWGADTAGPSMEGAFLSTQYLPSMPGSRNENFVIAYRRANQGADPDHRAAGTYDAINLLARAISARGTDRSRLRDYLAGIGTRWQQFDGVTGKTTFDGRGNAVDKEVVMAVVRDGQLTAAPIQ